MAKSKRRPGPKPGHLKIDDNWKSAVGKVLREKKPAKGWPAKKKKAK